MTNTSSSGGYLLPTTPPPASDVTLARELNNLIAGTTGLAGNKIRPRWQPEPAPTPIATEDWAALGVTLIDGEPGGPYVQHYGAGNGYDVLKQDDFVTVLVTFYGPNCQGLARVFKDGVFAIAQNWEEANVDNLNLQEAGPIRLFEEQVNSIWYRRADLEIVLRQRIERRYEIENILSAQGLISAQNNFGEIVENDFDTQNVRMPTPYDGV